MGERREARAERHSRCKGANSSQMPFECFRMLFERFSNDYDCFRSLSNVFERLRTLSNTFRLLSTVVTTSRYKQLQAVTTSHCHQLDTVDNVESLH